MAKRGKRKNKRSNRGKQAVTRVIPKITKKSEIKWREKDILNLRNAVRQFNSKLTRLEKQGKNLEMFMPERKNVKELKKAITSRDEYNKTIQSMKSFLKKGAEDIKISEKGLAVTKWEIQQVRNMEARARHLHNKYLEQMKKGTEKITTSKGEEEQALPTFDFSKRSIADYQRYLKILKQRVSGDYYIDKQNLYLVNYIRSIYKRYGKTEKVDELVDHLLNLGADEVVRQFYQNIELTIEFTYDLTLSDDQLFDKLKEKWFEITE